MISEQEFYYLWNDYGEIISKMQQKMIEFKTRNPKYDISEQIKTIETLIHLQNMFHKQYDLILTLDGHHGKWHSEKKRMLNRITELEKELKETKENINF